LKWIGKEKVEIRHRYDVCVTGLPVMKRGQPCGPQGKAAIAEKKKRGRGGNNRETGCNSCAFIIGLRKRGSGVRREARARRKERKKGLTKKAFEHAVRKVFIGGGGGGRGGGGVWRKIRKKTRK